MSRCKTVDCFIKEAINKHGDQYKYDLVVYISAHKQVEIICKKHGSFLQRANDHLRGKGCPNCANDIRALKTKTSKILSLDNWLPRAKTIHGELYDYSLAEYRGMHKKIKIICKKHGTFEQAAHSHLEGYGCSKCSSGGTSKLEQLWLLENNILEKYQRYPLTINGKLYRVDGFDPTTNTVYEFYGDFWHGNPKRYLPTQYNTMLKCSMTKLYLDTINREQALKLAGYDIVSIWESDYLAR